MGKLDNKRPLQTILDDLSFDRIIGLYKVPIYVMVQNKVPKLHYLKRFYKED